MLRDDFDMRVWLGLTISLACATNAAAVTVAFQGGTIRLAHTPDSGNGAIVSSQAPISGTPVPVSRLDSGGYSLDASNFLGSSNSLSKAKAAHITNSTTASIALRRGTGITQTDPANNYLGFSRTELTIPSPLTWNFGNDKFFPGFSRYASFTVAGNVGTGGFARFSCILNFRNSSNALLGVIQLSTGTITTAGPFTRTLTAAGPLSLVSGDQLRVSGNISFDVSNDEAPSSMVLEDGEVGGSEGETYLYNGGSRTWGVDSSWTTSSNVPTPTSINDRVVIARSSTTGIAGFDQVAVTGGMHAFGMIDVSGIVPGANRIVDISSAGGSLMTAGGFTGRPNFRTRTGTTLRVAPTIQVARNGIGVETETGSTIQFISPGNLSLASGFSGSINIAKTGGGTLSLERGLLTPLAINAAAGTVIVSGSGVGFTGTLNAQPAEGQTSLITVGRTVALTGIHVYEGGTVRIQRSLGSGTNTFRGGDLFVETGGVLDLANSSIDIIRTAGTLDPYPLFRDYILSGFAGGSWTGEGITSSFAATDATRRTGIGFIEPSGASPARVGYAYYGDANLSGTVDLNDFTLLAANFAGEGDWGQADFNYDGIINLDDFTSLAANFGLTLPADLPRSAVPEPSALAILMAIPIALVAKRRRRTRA